MPEFSVIIPVYKVEKYLRQCIDSVLYQKINDLEIILVDDGSPDGCPQICDEYARQYSYVSVIHKENGGLSSARNAGILAAQGTYLLFLDSDDYWNDAVSAQELFSIVRHEPQIEMLLFSSLDYFDGKGLFERKDCIAHQTIQTDNIISFYDSLLASGNLQVAAYTKVLKKSFITDHNLFFREGIVSEDNEWFLRLLRVLTHVAVSDVPLYVYRYGREGAITQTIKKKNISDLLSIVASSLEFYQENTSLIQPRELCYCSYLWFSALGLSTKLPKQEQAALREDFQKTVEVCQYSRSSKTRFCMALFKVTGLRFTAFVLGQYIRVKSKLHLHHKPVEA